MVSIIDWAQVHGRHFRWHCAVDNYEPTRNWGSGEGWEYDGIVNDARGPGIVLDRQVAQLRDSNDAIYLIDDGRTVMPYYVVGWKYEPGEEHAILHQFPVNFHPDGSPVLRADDQRPVNFSDWTLGPRRAYHLKITRSLVVVPPEELQEGSDGTLQHG